MLERRAASWLSDGRRTPAVFFAVDDDDEVVVKAAGAGAGVSVEFELIVVTEYTGFRNSISSRAFVYWKFRRRITAIVYGGNSRRHHAHSTPT